MKYSHDYSYDVDYWLVQFSKKKIEIRVLPTEVDLPITS